MWPLGIEAELYVIESSCVLVLLRFPERNSGPIRVHLRQFLWYPIEE